jgi:hypothetical protein
MLKSETSIVTTDAHSFYKQHKELLPPGVRLDASQKMELEVVLQGERRRQRARGWRRVSFVGCACVCACTRGWQSAEWGTSTQVGVDSALRDEL